VQPAKGVVSSDYARTMRQKTRVYWRNCREPRSVARMPALGTDLLIMDNKSMPPGDIIPVLKYQDVQAPVEWLCRVFGFRERLRIGEHRSQLTFGAGSVIVSDGLAAEPVSCSVMIKVADVDRHYRRSVESGARVLAEPQTYPFGERQYTVADLGGHHWTFSQTVEDVDPALWGGTLVGPPDISDT
jgi:uncharacterized glyoxalase superfamily protein PhnB